ncbi:response regulator [Halovenus sp. HT40]|uniref:response regulator n=1 Tax=Halovenus sp. HT40 TaxID=3126691 RepID=UPI00300F1334
MTGSAPTVLIVEDQRGLAEAYETVVGMDYDTRLATSGDDALEAMDESVDVVLLDRRMPGMSGDEVLAEFTEQGFSAMVAMLTAVEPGVDIVEMAFDAYVTKPIDNEELLDLVDTLLQRSEYDERVQQFFSLAAKKSALEAANKGDTDEYDQVITEMQTLHEELGSVLEEVSEQIDPRLQAD